MTSEGPSLFSSPEAQASIAKIKAVADGPVVGRSQAEYKSNMRFEMSVAHTFFLAALDQVYKNAEWAVEHDDVANFTGFALVIVHALIAHHAFEEELWFPAVEKAAGKPGHLTANIDQHHAFAPHIHALEGYLMAIHASLVPSTTKLIVPVAHADSATDMKRFDLDPTAPFDAAKMRTVLEDMVDTLSVHLADELDTIGPELFENVSRTQYLSLAAMVDAYLKAEDPATFLVVAYTMFEYEFAKKAMPLPWFVRLGLLPYVFAPKHKGFWRYSLHPENVGLAYAQI